jgi:alkaline phosphatase D
MRLLSLCCLLLAPTASAPAQSEPPTRIAFGSCFRQSKPAPIWSAIQAQQPDALVLLGDSVYADSADPAVIREAWNGLAAHPGFAALRSQSHLLATWDDHDYGADDGGADFLGKAGSQQEFLNFLGVAQDDPRRQRAGVYHSEIHGEPGRRVQFILLDTRFARSPQRAWSESQARPEGMPGPYAPQVDPQARMLSEDQWQWLETQLRKPAEVRILGTSIQALAEDHGWESWSRFPRERARLFALLARTRASGVILVSGDRHHAELACLPSTRDGMQPDYPLWELTASSLNQPKAWQFEAHRWRVGDAYFANNFGMLEIDWDAPGIGLELRVHAEDGAVLMRQTMRLDQLQAKPEAMLHSEQILERIALGSCNEQTRPTPLWQPLLASDPDLLLLLGDNVYIDSEDPAKIQAGYDALAKQAGFAEVRESMPILATWDDHDYGWNDSDRHYPSKQESRRIMLDFFAAPVDSPRRSRSGIYESWLFGPPEQRVQIILLDLRWNKSPWNRRGRGPLAGDGFPGSYAPSFDPQSTLLGEEQWAWFADQLQVPARLRLIGSSLQALSTGSQWEGWAMMPLERQRLFRTLRDSGAGGVLLVSGDTHWAELARVQPVDSGVRYPLYELTTSGLNHGWEFTQIHNPQRIGLPYWTSNWGLIEIDWQTPDPTIRLQALGEDGRGIRHQLRLSELQPQPSVGGLPR